MSRHAVKPFTTTKELFEECIMFRNNYIYAVFQILQVAVKNMKTLITSLYLIEVIQ